MKQEIIITRRFFVIGLGLASCTSGGGGGGTSSGPMPTTSEELGGVVTNVSNEGLVYMNEYRKQGGVAALTESLPCSQAAMHHALSMAYTGTMDHWVDDPRGWGAIPERLKHFGVPLPHAENVNYGYANVQRSVAAWYGSPGHNRNLMDPAYKHSAMAVAKHPNSKNTPYYCSVYSA